MEMEVCIDNAVYLLVIVCHCLFSWREMPCWSARKYVEFYCVNIIDVTTFVGIEEAGLAHRCKKGYVIQFYYCSYATDSTHVLLYYATM